jgi:hypothetical protein
MNTVAPAFDLGLYSANFLLMNAVEVDLRILDGEVVLMSTGM